MDDYSALIDGIYIKPIRTVIALDDQFPTLDVLLNSHATSQETVEVEGEVKTFARVSINPNEIGKAKSLVAYCREQQWIVDIHDGSKILGKHSKDEGTILRHLHQTDLLILDYKLQGETLGGDHAIDILRALNGNEHFNIVVVYTKEEVVKTFLDIELSLLASHQFPSDHDDRIAEVWQQWLDEDTGTFSVLEGHIDLNLYRYVRRFPDVPSWSDIKKKFPNVATFTKEVGTKLRTIVDCPFTAQDVGWWLLKKQQSKVQPKFHAKGETNVEGVEIPTDQINWLRTGTLFLTVVHKDIEGASIVDHLRRALCDWRPSPHRLIISSMRADLDERGGTIEEAALRNSYLQAGLLQQLLTLSGEARLARLAQILEHHWSEILREMKICMVDASAKILDVVAASSGGTADKTILSHFSWYLADNADQRQKIFLALNSYVSTQPVEGQHLTAGHVFKFGEAFWVCLSPICDLVPDQNKKTRWRATLGEAMPFKAVKLTSVGAQSAIDHATSSLCLFLPLGDRIECFSFLPLGGELGDASPHWEQMFADNQGRVAKNNTTKIGAVRIDNDGRPVLTAFEEVQIVAQLKYEYALNLLQRLGNSLSRVGLDYVKPN